VLHAVKLAAPEPRLHTRRPHASQSEAAVEKQQALHTNIQHARYIHHHLGATCLHQRTTSRAWCSLSGTATPQKQKSQQGTWQAVCVFSRLHAPGSNRQCQRL